MRTILISATMLVPVTFGAASAQLPDVTGQVQGTVRQSTQVETQALVNDGAMIDQRSGLRLDTQLIGRLNGDLPEYNRANASARLASALESNARSYSRVRTRSDASGGITGRMGRPDYARATPEAHARVHVYSSDGYRVGYVHRYDGDSDGRVVIRGDGDNASVRAVSASQASFDSDANAVVIAKTRSEFQAMSELGS